MKTNSQQTAHTILPVGYRLARGDDGFYHVSTTTYWRGIAVRQLAEFPDKDGYLYVRITDQATKRRFKRFLHRLVCELTHGPKPTPQHEARHLDGNRENNTPGNLQWGTRKENAADRAAHGNTSAGMKHSEAVRAGRSQVARLEAEKAELLAALELHLAFLKSLPRGWLGKTSGDIGALNDAYLMGNKALAKAKGVQS